MKAKVTEALEHACVALRHYEPFWRNPASAEEVFWWEYEDALCEVPFGSTVEQRGKHDLVYDRDKRLVPKLTDNGPGCIYDDEKGAQLIIRALRGDPIAKCVLHDIAAEFIESGCELPSRLRDFIAKELRAPVKYKRRGPDRKAHYNRNFFIAWIILHIVNMGFRPTRNRATQNQESACSVVAKALARSGLHLSEGAVEKIWGQLGPMFTEALTAS